MPDASYGSSSYQNYYAHQQQLQNELVNRVPNSSSSYVSSNSGSYPSHYPPPSSPSSSRPGRMVDPSSYRRPSYPGPLEQNSSLANERNEETSVSDDSQQPGNRGYYPER